MKVFLGGEGPHELGDWGGHPSYRAGEPGVLEALLRKAGGQQFEVAGAVSWKQIRKFKAGQHRGAERRNVLGLALKANEAGATVLAFVRDRDGDAARQQDVESGICDARNEYPDLPIIGGVAIEELEAWMLALLGESQTQRHADAKAELDGRHGVAGRRAMLDVVERAALDQLPQDAESLSVWIRRAQAVLGSP